MQYGPIPDIFGETLSRHIEIKAKLERDGKKIGME